MLIAEAIFFGDHCNGITGTVVFTQHYEKLVRVDIDLQNVPIGIHGIHVHEKRINFNRKEDFCMQAKGHFNGSLKLWSPKFIGGTPHGSWRLKSDRHIGDLCNNIVSIDGTVSETYYDQLISLIPRDPNCIIGRSIIIHADRDDEGLCMNLLDLEQIIESKITGNAGHRIACANIYRYIPL